MASASENIVVVDYGMGNVGSIANMLQRLEVPGVISGDPQVIAQAKRLILPGVGAFDHGMRELESRGLLPILNHKALVERVPVLGICLGMQLLGKSSEEGQLPGLGWIDARTRRFCFDNLETQPRVPHMEWNSVRVCRHHPVLPEAGDPWRFYFVHSYFVECRSDENVLAVTSYGIPFTSAVARDNLVGVQFHPEKSHRFGMRLLQNFVNWNYEAARAATTFPKTAATEQQDLPFHSQTRVIPCLLVKNGGLVKTVRFSKPKYVGDPINAVKIFNDKQVDELAVLDISATVDGRRPNVDLIQRIAGEAFMPVAYGGGVESVDDVRRIVKLGIEKVVINSRATDRSLIRAAAEIVGSQSVVVSIDVKRHLFGRYEVLTHSGTRATGIDPVTYAQEVAAAGAGEIVLNSIDRDGTMSGYDIPLVKRVTSAVSIPVIALGGASSVTDLADAAFQGGAAAVAAGSLFVFHGKHRAVLITYPDRPVLDSVLSRQPLCRKSAAVA